MRLPTGNLPAELSSFVGRRGDLAEVRRLLSAARLVTLTGVGGVGKSRLGVRAAGAMRRSFADGIWLVELAGLQDQFLVPQAVSNALGIADQTDRDPMDVLAAFLANRRLLLVLDNCEHLVHACALLVSHLLPAAPELRVLATSRESLGIIGEQVYPVLPLPVPDPDASLGVEAGFRYSGLELFRQRAAGVRSDFAIAAENVNTVARVCRRLDGIPLAIELAAARLRALSLAQIATRLDDRFRLLTTGNRGAVERHQTLRAAVGWSFELCTKPERLVWMRSSVFSDRFDPAAAERVCDAEGLSGEDVFEALVGLVGKSVLIAEEHGGETRYRMLDTIREFGLDRLRTLTTDDPAVVDERALRRRHRDWYIEVAERFDADWFGPHQVMWAKRMRAELPNIRAALGWCLEDKDETPAGLRLAGALYFFWFGTGEFREGRLWLERLLSADPRPCRERVRALAAYARLLFAQGDYGGVVGPARECLELARAFDEPFCVTDALQLHGLSVAYQDDVAAARPLLEEALVVAGGLGDTSFAMAHAALALAAVAFIQGDLVHTGEMCGRSAAICRARGDRWWLGGVLHLSLSLELARGDPTAAGSYGRESLRARSGLGDGFGISMGLELLAWVAAAAHEHVRAARLLGAADRQWEALGGTPYSAGAWLRSRQDCANSAREALGETAFDTEVRRGVELSLDHAVSYALGDTAAPLPRAPALQASAPGAPTPLTRREREIAELVAQGLSNRQIAERLVIGQRTVESHVEHLLAKLGFGSRTQIVTWHLQVSAGPPEG